VADQPEPPASRSRSVPDYLVWGGAVVAILAGLVHAVYLRWTCDDAFISFRYARNLVEGNGLVFNVGEAVEGYTNFLWTLGIALGWVAGIDPIPWTHSWGVAAWLFIAVGLALHAHRAGRWPIAAAVWAAFPYGRMFATSGLETMSFAAISTAAILVAWRSEDRRSGVLAGVLAALALMSRPEGGLAVATVTALIGLRSWKRLPEVLGPIALLVLPWLAFKLSFYGELLPNTYYAKAGAGAQWAHGLMYLRLFFVSNVLLGVGIFAWVLPPGPDRPADRGRFVVLAYFAVYLAHIARSGGDFMYARFCVPLVPLACLGLEQAFELGRRQVPRMQAIVWVLPVGVLLAPAPQAIFGDIEDGGVGAGGVVDERSWYPAGFVDLAQEQGAVLAGCVSQTPVRVAYYGTQAMLMYYGRLPYALEPHVGLTDYELARMPPPEGSRVGHGQKADDTYLRARDIDLVFGYRMQLPTTQITRVDFPGGISGRMLSYRRPVVAALRDCGARLLDFEKFLDQWIVELPTVDDARVAKAYASFSDYYFQHNHDPTRENPFRARLGLEPRSP
jgi:hypothetical protein